MFFMPGPPFHVSNPYDSDTFIEYHSPKNISMCAMSVSS
jgi:hypothetical protein